MKTGQHLLDFPDAQSELLAQELREHSHAQVKNRLARRSRLRLLHLSTLGWSSVDCIIGFLAFVIGQKLTPYSSILNQSFAHLGDFVPRNVSTISGALSLAALLWASSHVMGLHTRQLRYNLLGVILRVTLAVAIAISLLLVFWSVMMFQQIGRYVLLGTAVSALIMSAFMRAVVLSGVRTYPQKVCFVGSDKFYSEIAEISDRFPAGTITTTIENYSSVQSHEVCQYALQHGIDQIVFDDRVEELDDQELLSCMDSGVKVSTYVDFMEETFGLVPVEHIDARWLLGANVDLAHPYYSGAKRIADVILGAIGLTLSLPLMALAALAIKLSSKGGPVFYSQIRVGQFNRPFRIYKLRTMVTNAEAGKAQWATRNDSRVTPVGRLLRITRMDELPQFWNIIRGDMSLIGPRPERPEFVTQLEDEIPYYMRRHLIKPGLTGWAQINYPYGASVEDARCKLSYDLYYIKNVSGILDFQILLRTVGAIMQGAR